MNTELQQFVREALARGIPREQVRATLAAARWRAEEIDAEMERWADGPGGLPVPRRRLSLSAREAFMHLVVFATLYTFAYSAGVVLFALIGLHWPDPALGPRGDAIGAMRGALAALVTAFPIFLWTSWLVGRSLAREPEKRASGIRRWLTYLTLFVAVVTLISNFAAVISSLLSGELRIRILLQSAVVFAIAGLVFGHYLLGLRRDESEGAGGPVQPGWLGRIGALATVLVVIAGFVTVGSPGRARGRTLDGQRVERLNSLASKIENHVQGQRELPASLEPLYRKATNYESPNFLDPATGQLFEYAVVDSETYHLGATFATADTLDQYGNPVPLEWRHAAGHVTFTLHARVDGPRRAVVSRDGPHRY